MSCYIGGGLSDGLIDMVYAWGLMETMAVYGRVYLSVKCVGWIHGMDHVVRVNTMDWEVIGRGMGGHAPRIHVVDDDK